MNSDEMTTQMLVSQMKLHPGSNLIVLSVTKGALLGIVQVKLF